MPAIPVQDMISNIQAIVDDADANVHSPTELLRYINGSIGKYDALMAAHARKILMQHRDITHDGDELSAVMPYLPRIISVERTSSSPRQEVLPIDGGFRSRWPYLTSSPTTAPGGYYVQNNQLAVVPAQGGGTDRVWVVLRTPELHYGVADASSTTSSLVFASTPTLGNIVAMDDAYNMIPVMLTASREVNVITDYARATRACTMQFTFENAPASLAYSVLPPIDPEFHWLYIWDTIITAKMRTDENKIDAASERSTLEGLLLANVTRYQSQHPRYMRRMGW